MRYLARAIAQLLISDFFFKALPGVHVPFRRLCPSSGSGTYDAVVKFAHLDTLFTISVDQHSLHPHPIC